MATLHILELNEYAKLFKEKKLTKADLTKLLRSIERTQELCEKCRRLTTLWHLLGTMHKKFDFPLDAFPKLYNATSLFVVSPGFNHGVEQGLKVKLSRSVGLVTKIFPHTAPQCQALTMAIMDPWSNTHPSELNDILIQHLLATECPEFLAVRVEALYRQGLLEQALMLCLSCLEYYMKEVFMFPYGKKDRRIRPYVLFLAWKFIFESSSVEEDMESLVAYLYNQVKDLSCHEGSYLLTVLVDKCPNSLDLRLRLSQVLLLHELNKSTPSLCCTRHLMQQWLAILLKHGWGSLDVEKNVRLLMKEYAVSSSHFYIMVKVLFETFGFSLVHLYVELFVRALTSDRNQLEGMKNRGESTEDFRHYISEALSYLAVVLPRQYARVAQYCSVTAFSLHPHEGKLVNLQYLTRCPQLPAEPPPPDCVCGGRCLTPTREDPVPEYTEPIPPHYVLDASIPGVPSQTLEDLAALLEGMTSQLLSPMGTWREIGPSFNEFLRAVVGKQLPLPQPPDPHSDSESDSEVAKKASKNDPRINMHLLSLRKKNLKLQMGPRKDVLPFMTVKKLQQPAKKKVVVNESPSLIGDVSCEDGSHRSHYQHQQQPMESQEPRPSIITTVITRNPPELLAPPTLASIPDETGQPPPNKIPRVMESWVDSGNSLPPGSPRGDETKVVVNNDMKRKEEHLILKRIFGSDFDPASAKIQQSHHPQQQYQTLQQQPQVQQQYQPLQEQPQQQQYQPLQQQPLQQQQQQQILPQQQLPQLMHPNAPMPTTSSPQLSLSPQPLEINNSGVRDKPYKYVVPIPTIKKLLYQANHTNKLTLGFVVKDSSKVRKVEFPISPDLARQLANKHSGSIIIEPSLVDKSHRIIFSPSNRSSGVIAQRTYQVKATAAASPVSSTSPTAPVLNLSSYKMASTPPAADHPQYSTMLKSLPSVSHADSSQQPPTDNSRPLPPYSQIKLKNPSFFSSPTTPPTNQSSPTMVPSSQSIATSSSYTPAPQSYDSLYPATDSGGSQGVDLSLSFRDSQNSYFDSPQQPPQQQQLVSYDGMNFPQSSDTLYHHQPPTPDSSSSSYQYFSPPPSYPPPRTSPGAYALEQSPPKAYYPTKPSTYAPPPQASYEESDPAKKNYLHHGPPTEPQYYSSPSTFRVKRPQLDIQQDEQASAELLPKPSKLICIRKVPAQQPQTNVTVRNIPPYFITISKI